MDSDASSVANLSMNPLRRRKIIHLVRHAQGIHNLENSAKSKTSPELIDAKLSPLGWKQIDSLRENVVSVGLLNRIQLVVVSPLLRTMETAIGVFGGKTEIPFVAVEMCRERLGVNTCDKRRNVSEYKTLFPTIDFSLIETEEDTWWTPDVRESDDDVAARGIKFFNWLWSREEEEIAVVTHSAFLFQTLNKFGDDCQESVTSQMRKFFQNCELRSMELADGKGVNTCDKRRNVSEYKTLFPTIDFSLIETEEDTWWTPDVRESDDDVAARGIKFFNWLWSREEEEIAVVTHSAFLFQTLNKFGDDCQESVTTYKSDAKILSEL